MNLQVMRGLLPGGSYEVEDFHYAYDKDASGLTNSLVLRVISPNKVSLNIRFGGVRNLKLLAGPFAKITLAGLLIEDLSTSQLEDVRFHVTSEEELAWLSLDCWTIDIDVN